MSDPSTRPAIRVIKLGGSLLETDGLAGQFRAWRIGQAPMRDVMIAGGGRMADAVRDAFSRHGLSEEAAHWLCIRVLGVTAELAARLLPEATLLRSLPALRECLQTSSSWLAVFEVEDFLRHCEPRPSGLPLPHTWDVTSDSIAARLAEAIGAAELVLLKSAPPPAGGLLSDWAEAGYVDRFFPQAAAGVRSVRAVSLRA